MSPPSSRKPPDPTGSGAEGPSSGRGRDRTMFEFAQPPQSAPPKRTEKRTLFGFALDTLGMAQRPPEKPSEPSAARVAPVHGVGTPAPSAPEPMQTTTPQYAARAGQRSANERTDARVAPAYAPPPNSVHVARPVQTPMPAQPIHAAPEPVHDAAPASYGRGVPPGQPYSPPPAGHAAPGAAGSAPAAANRLHASAAALHGPDGATAFVDMRQFMGQGVELPAAGRSDDSASSWAAQAGVVTEPAAPPRAPAVRWARHASSHDGEQIDLNFVLGRRSARGLLLFGSCIVALLLAGLTMFLRAAPSAAPPQQVAAPVRVPKRVAAPPAAEVEPSDEHAPSPASERGEPTQAAAAADDDAPNPSAERASAATQLPVAEEPAASVGSQRVSATPERAAILYIGGKYKEALAEYTLLAAAYPKQRVYRELARILKRKIIDTCLRTQPTRREQCAEL